MSVVLCSTTLSPTWPRNQTPLLVSGVLLLLAVASGAGVGALFSLSSTLTAFLVGALFGAVVLSLLPIQMGVVGAAPGAVSVLSAGAESVVAAFARTWTWSERRQVHEEVFVGCPLGPKTRPSEQP